MLIVRYFSGHWDTPWTLQASYLSKMTWAICLWWLQACQGSVLPRPWWFPLEHKTVMLSGLYTGLMKEKLRKSREKTWILVFDRCSTSRVWLKELHVTNCHGWGHFHPREHSLQTLQKVIMSFFYTLAPLQKPNKKNKAKPKNQDPFLLHCFAFACCSSHLVSAPTGSRSADLPWESFLGDMWPGP